MQRSRGATPDKGSWKSYLLFVTWLSGKGFIRLCSKAIWGSKTFLVLSAHYKVDIATKLLAILMFCKNLKKKRRWYIFEKWYMCKEKQSNATKQNELERKLLPSSHQWLTFPEKQSSSFFFLTFIYFFWLCRVVLAPCGKWDLVPWPGIEPGLPALGTWSLRHWTQGSCKVIIF